LAEQIIVAGSVLPYKPGIFMGYSFILKKVQK